MSQPSRHNPNSNSYWTWLCFFKALNASYLPICTTDSEEYDLDFECTNYFEIQIADTRPSPEKIVMKKETFNRLSPDAHFVVDLVLAEPIEIINKRSHKVSKNILINHLRHNGWQLKKVQKVLRELREFVMTF